MRSRKKVKKAAPNPLSPFTLTASYGSGTATLVLVHYRIYKYARNAGDAISTRKKRKKR